ncbi:hypothetical protein HN51_039780, partial [Arachis hypogaea]
LVFLSLSLLWICLGKIMILCGQDPLISQEAEKFAVCLIPTYLLMLQFSPSFAIFLCKFQLGNLGSAFSIGILYWLNVILLGLYMKFSTQCEMTCAPISMELFHDFGEFLCYTVPSAGMIYLEWWSFELLTLPSELLPNPELEVSFLSI